MSAIVHTYKTCTRNCNLSSVLKLECQLGLPSDELTRSDRYTYGIYNTRIITYTYNMYIMYRIQGYIARTVNHDQKVPKHWREIENEREEYKQKENSIYYSGSYQHDRNISDLRLRVSR